MENTILITTISYFLLISCFGMILMVVDKKKAVKNQWRIPEKTLITIGLLGAALSMYIVSQVIRHKTTKPKFSIGLPTIFAIQVIVVMYWFL